MQKYLLWDSSVVVGYYIPTATKNTRAAKRANIILDAVRNHRLNAFCYIPNIVIAEVFTVFARECYSSWDSQIYKKYGGRGKTLDTRKYKTACKEFHQDIHNGALFYQYELNRYHVLALDLIAPVDKYRKFYRSSKNNDNTKSMGASDLLIGAMGIHLTKIHGKDSTAILTADRRMEAIFANACPRLTKRKAEQLGLVDKANELKLAPWGESIYPNVIDLERASDKTLSNFFGQWPLNTRKTRGRDPKA